MNICIIGPKDSAETLAIKTEAESRGHNCKRIYMSDIYFEVKNSRYEVFHRKIELKEFDVFLFRAINKSIREATLMAKFLHEEGKIVIDSCLYMGAYKPANAVIELSLQDIPVLDQYQTGSLKSARDVLMEIEHPILVKYLNEKNKLTVVASEEWTESYDLVRTNKQKKFSFQQYVDAQSYNRIFVINGKTLGGVRKTILDEEPKMQYSSKFKLQKVALTSEQEELAIKACKALKIEIGAVDIIEQNNELFVIEVHRSPKFLRFEKLTKINFAESILEYIESL